jgi:GT2 family glycosyltransferase
VLDRLQRQTADPAAFEVVVAADAAEADLRALDELAKARPFPVRRLQASRPGASAARNAGWRAAQAPLILFLDDDILPEAGLIAEHLAWHGREPGEEVGVLGRVRWADELRVTPFMKWLDRGIQFNFGVLRPGEVQWGYFVTANASVKRALVERVGGFDEETLPFGYEDLDLALRMHREHGFRLLYNPAACAEHVHPMDLDFWRRRVRRIAISERRFCAKHLDFPPYFHQLFASAAAAPPAKGRGERLARYIPESLPLLGPWVWGSADSVYRQALAGPFLEAWESAD